MAVVGKGSLARRIEMKRFYLFATLLLSLWLPAAHADVALSASLGSFFQSDEEWNNPNLDFTASLWYPVDQMVLAGISSGLQSIGTDQEIPLLASLYLRLPIGRQLLPIATADWGYLFRKEKNRFVWRIAGGGDLKLGDRSSIIALIGSQMEIQNSLPNRYFARLGLLLEW